jgi:hypothetical protein
MIDGRRKEGSATSVIRGVNPWVVIAASKDKNHGQTDLKNFRHLLDPKILRYRTIFHRRRKTLLI